MSGGHFDYRQYQIHEAAETIERLIETNDDESKDEWGYRVGRGYSPEIILKFKEAAHTLHQAAEMLHRVDMLVSDDDGEEAMLVRWGRGVRAYWKEC